MSSAAVRAAYNPEPIAEFFDLFYIGEGETVYDPLLDLYKEMQGSTAASRKEFLRTCGAYSGHLCAVLSMTVTYKEDGTIACVYAQWRRTCLQTVEKQISHGCDERCHTRKQPVVPYIKATQDRVVLEIQRGCIRGCRFCQAGMLYRPTREKSLENLKQHGIPRC